MAQIPLGHPTHVLIIVFLIVLRAWTGFLSVNFKYAAQADVREEGPPPPRPLRYYPIIVPYGQYLNSSTEIDYIGVQGTAFSKRNRQ